MRPVVITRKKDDAVSPVVGVMLMLVVTIVIAAVVAAFAGGLGTDVEKAPTISISGTYSQTAGLALTHLGGDDVILADIYVRPSTGFGNYNKLAWKTKSIDAKDIWSAGEIIQIQKDDIQPATDGTVDSSGSTPGGNKGESSYYGFNNATNIGKYMTVEVIKDGKTIASTEVKIAA